jgi:hypothetical protein
MRCERVQELLSDYYEGTIQGAVLVPLESHLHSCSACREEWDGLREVWRVLNAAPVVEPPADFHAAVWRRIEADRRSQVQTARRPAFSFDWRSLFTRPALGWAAAVLVVLVLSGVAVPGVFTQARLVFPWNLFHSVQKEPVGSGVRVGQPQIVSEGTKNYLKIPVVNPGHSAVSVDVVVESGSVENDHVTVAVPPDSTGLYLVTSVTGDGQPLKVNVSWQQNGAIQSKPADVPTR